MESNDCGMICGAIPAFVWRDRGSSQKRGVRISCLWSQMWTQADPGMKQNCHVWDGIFFFFCIGLIWILCHVINTWYLSL